MNMSAFPHLPYDGHEGVQCICELFHAHHKHCASVPFIAAAAWFTCDTTLLDLLGGVLALLGAGTLFRRHMAHAFGVVLARALLCMEHCSLGTGHTPSPP